MDPHNKPVPTQFTLYDIMAHGYDWSGQIILETENLKVCSKYVITLAKITVNDCYFLITMYFWGRNYPCMTLNLN